MKGIRSEQKKRKQLENLHLNIRVGIGMHKGHYMFADVMVGGRDGIFVHIQCSYRGNVRKGWVSHHFIPFLGKETLVEDITDAITYAQSLSPAEAWEEGFRSIRDEG